MVDEEMDNQAMTEPSPVPKKEEKTEKEDEVVMAAVVNEKKGENENENKNEIDTRTDNPAEEKKEEDEKDKNTAAYVDAFTEKENGSSTNPGDNISSTGRCRRERKSTDKFDPNDSAYSNSKKKDFKIGNGKGIALQDMPNVVENFKKVTWSDPNLKALYGIVFGVGKKKEFKSHLLQFNGFVYSSGDDDKDDDNWDTIREKKNVKINKLNMDHLKRVMDLCDIDRSTDSFKIDNSDGGSKKTPGKEMLCNRFLEWLEHPKSNTNKQRSSSSSASSTKTKKKKRKSSSSSSPSTTKTTTAKKRKSSDGEKKQLGSKKAKNVQKGEDDDDDSGSIMSNTIPGVSSDKIREKIGKIVSSCDKQSLTMKGVRKTLEDWLDADLTKYKDYVRALTMEFLV